MKFNRATDWAEVSDDSRYSVAAAKVNGLFKFEAWLLPKTPLGTFDTAKEARECCRKHAEPVEVA